MPPSVRKLLRSGYPFVTPVARDAYRLTLLGKFLFAPVSRAIKWYLNSKEYTNFTYRITHNSKKYLAALLANAFQKPVGTLYRYIEEIDNDRDLAAFFLRQVRKTSDQYFADLPIEYGRRVGWYALVRLLKPSVIIESGVDRGIGTCLLAAALLRNAREGRPGKVIALDINSFAGGYIAQPYDAVVELVIGDSLKYLRAAPLPVDLFIHDSDHRAEHEQAEYEAVKARLSPVAVVLSDNAEATDRLYEFAMNNSMTFWYWQEVVEGHPFPGGGLGFAVRLPSPPTHGRPVR